MCNKYIKNIRLPNYIIHTPFVHNEILEANTMPHVISLYKMCLPFILRFCIFTTDMNNIIIIRTAQG